MGSPEKMPPLHIWWARRPLAAARAVLFAQMVDDPSSRPEIFPTEEALSHERQAFVPHQRRVGEMGEHHQRSSSGTGEGGDTEELEADP